MKKTITVIILSIATITLCTAFIIKNSNGKSGYTGSPSEATCANCHGGGTSAAKSISITASPAFIQDKYLPDSAYTVSITVNATGFSEFGFGCEILNMFNLSIGNMQTAGPGVQFLNAGNGRKNATHTTSKVGTNSATFTFTWIAPSAGGSDAIFYVCGNAVNGNNAMSGDLPIPYSYSITEGVAPTPTNNVSFEKTENYSISKFYVAPNPTQDFTKISYFLNESKNIQIELVEISGKIIKEFVNEVQIAGPHNQLLDLTMVAPGIYFIKATANGQKITQKLISIN